MKCPLITTLLALAAAAVHAGCAYRITPPQHVGTPVTVLIADYGYHASLVLPRGDSGAVEYAFGEFWWYAHNHDNLWRAPGILLVGGGGTLGRREFGLPCSRRSLEWLSPGAQIIEVRVESARALALVAMLDARFAQSGDAPTYNPLMAMDFVPVPERYSMLANCNAAVAGWLRDLGCQVDGFSASADFRLRR